MRSKKNSDVQVEKNAEQKPKWTFKGWYEQNKEALAERRKARYHSDKKYRQKVLEQNKDYRAKKAGGDESKPKGRGRAPKHRRPVQMTVTIGGELKQVNMVHIGAFARAIGRSVPTIHQWERVGVLPRTPFLLRGENKEERLYTAEMIGIVSQALSTRGVAVSASDTAFRDEIYSGWVALGIPMEKSS